MAEKVGTVFKYFDNVEVAAVKAEGDIKIGDTLHFKGDDTDFTQKVESMQIDGEDVKEVHAGDDVGIKVKEKVKENDEVLKD